MKLVGSERTDRGLMWTWEWMSYRHNTARAQLKVTSVTEKSELRVIRHSGPSPQHTHKPKNWIFTGWQQNKTSCELLTPCQILPECHSATFGRNKFMRILIKIFLLFSIQNKLDLVFISTAVIHFIYVKMKFKVFQSLWSTLNILTFNFAMYT